MPHWVRVSELAEHPPGTAWECAVEDRILALFNVAGEISALDGVCPHQGGPLGRGRLTDGTITCPWHGWQFDVRTGQSLLSRTICQPVYAVRVEDGAVWVDLQSVSPD